MAAAAPLTLPALMEGLSAMSLATPPNFVDAPTPMSASATTHANAAAAGRCSYMDILDLGDMERVAMAQVFQEAFFVPNLETPLQFVERHKPFDAKAAAQRLGRASITLKSEFEISLRDLACWTSSSTQQSRCKAYPFLTEDRDNSPGLARRCFVPLQASLRILTSAASLPREFQALSAGCSIAMSNLESQTNRLGYEAAQKDPVLANYMALTGDEPSRLLYQTHLTDNGLPVLLLQPPTAEQVQALCRDSFVTNSMLDRGTSQLFVPDATIPSKRRHYRIIPEYHGMAEQLKLDLPRYVSACRVFADRIKPDETKLFLRVPEESFIAAATKFKQDKLLYGQEQGFLGDVSVYIALVQPGQPGYDPVSAKARPEDPEGFDKKHSIQVELSLEYLYSKARPDQDVFLSDPAWIGKFPSGLSYMDPLSDQYTQNADNSWVLVRRAEIPSEVPLAEYLYDHRVRRVNYVKKNMHAKTEQHRVNFEKETDEEAAAAAAEEEGSGTKRKLLRNQHRERRPELNYLNMLYQEL